MQLIPGTMWKRIANAGMHQDLPSWEARRVRLLNGVCTLAIAFFLAYAILFTQPDARLVFWECIQGMLLYTVPVMLNRYRRYRAARFFFLIYSTLVYTFFAVAHGSGYGSEYLLLPVGICALLFFKDVKTAAALFLFNGLCFALCKYSFTILRPFIHRLPSVNAYYFNHLVLFLALLLVVLYFRRENNRQESLLHLRADQLDAEKRNADGLLLNILPAEIAEELKTTGTSQPRFFERVTVLFTHFENTTALSEQLSAEDLVAEINHCFSAFDAVMQENGIEKIKTVGEDYLCAGGLSERTGSRSTDVVAAALSIRDFMQQYKAERKRAGRPCYEVRIGIHTGPVVAGVVGLKKFAYDIWGDTVNTASRMQSSGEVGKINVSGATFDLIKDAFFCTPRGQIEAKHKGMIEMYFVERAKLSGE